MTVYFKQERKKSSDFQLLHLEIVMFYLSAQIPIKSRSEIFVAFQGGLHKFDIHVRKVSSNQIVKTAGLGHFSYRCMKTLYRYEVNGFS